MGNLQERRRFLEDIRDLPRTLAATDEEALAFVEANALSGRGIGYVDIHLLAATHPTPDARLWTRDQRLEAAAVEMNLAFVLR